MSESGVNIALIGATGAMGEAVLTMLAECDIPIANLSLVASEASTGKALLFGTKSLRVQDLAAFDFSGITLALFCVPPAVARQYAPRAIELGCNVLDISSAFHADVEVPLVMAGVNDDWLPPGGAPALVSVPGASVLQLLSVLWPLSRNVAIDRIHASIFQAASLQGHKGVEELASQAVALLNAKGVKPSVFPRQLAFNIIPQVGALNADGHTSEELDIANALQRLLVDDPVMCTLDCIQVPVFFGLSIAMTLEMRESLSVGEIREILRHANGVSVSEKQVYRTGADDMNGEDRVVVGRVREDLAGTGGIQLWTTSDNVRMSARHLVTLAGLWVKSLEN